MSRPILIVREALLACPLVALVVAFTVALHVPNHAFLEAWLGGAALLAVPLALFIAAGRLARRSLDELLPGSRRALFVGVAVWAFLSFPVDAVLGLVLKATTHHRGLGGATFGALALGANLAAALLAWRFSVTFARRIGMVRVALNGCMAVAAVVFTVIGARAALATPGGATLLDGVVAVVATLLAARWDAPPRRSRAA
jgi:choline-sulfatase